VWEFSAMFGSVEGMHQEKHGFLSLFFFFFFFFFNSKDIYLVVSRIPRSRLSKF
jgi:hypothetical protein